MPGKKANKPKVSQIPKDTRVSADKILLDFLQKNKIVLIADEVSLVTNIVPGTIFVVDKRPRIRVYYADQIDKLKKPEEKIDIAS